MFCLGFVSGVWLLQFVPSLAFFNGLFIGISFLTLVVLVLAIYRVRDINRTKLKLILQFTHHFLIICIALTLGFLYAASLATTRLSDALAHENEQQLISIIGVVSSLPVHTERAIRFDFDVEKTLTLGADAKPIHVPQHISLMEYQAGFSHAVSSQPSKLLNQHFHVGQRWQLRVKLKRPHGTYNPHGFDFEAWAISENMRSTGTIKSNSDNKLLKSFVWKPRYIVESLREKTVNRINTVLLNKAYSAEISALVAGDDSAISADNWLVYLRTGVNHLMSISGLHITMLAGLAFGAVSFLWRKSEVLSLKLPARKAATLAGLFAACAYSLIAGFSIPTQRTLYMLAIFAVALWGGRSISLTRVLSIALVVVVLFDPWSVNAPGFWLSFGAVGVIAYALSGQIGQPHWLLASIKTQWAVTIGLVPVLILMFGQTSIISPIANAIAIPLISVVVVPLALLGSFLPVDWALVLAHYVFAFCMLILQWLASLPHATWQQAAPPFWAIILSMIGTIWLLLPKGITLRWMGLFLFIPMLTSQPLHPQLGAMQVTVLDVGQGLAVVIQTKNHTLLYDTGPKYSAQSDSGSRIIVPFLRGEGITNLDGIMLSHNDLDHSGGLNSVLAQVPIKWLDSSIPMDTKLGATIDSKQVNLMRCYAGQQWVWDDVKFDVLYPSIASYSEDLTDNNRSCVLKVTSQYGSILLTGDIEKEAEFALLQNNSENLDSDVLVAPHHGSKTSSTIDFIQAVDPSTTIFTAGYLNRFKHPKPEVLARYQANLSEILRSDTSGAVTVNFAAPNQNRLEKIQIMPYRKIKHRYWQDEELSE